MEREFKITLVIPTYSLSEKLIEMAYKCAKSHREQVDQIIISEDGGEYSDKLRDISDIYIYNSKNYGFTKNVNTAWKLSEGDFTIIANSDTYLVEGNLEDLCIDGFVTSPYIINMENPKFLGSYFVVPKSLLEDYGMLDERLIMYNSDIDYYMRIWFTFKKEGRVKIYHQKAQTVKNSKEDMKQRNRLDTDIYNQIVLEEHKGRLEYEYLS